MSVEKFAEGFSKLESSIHALLSCTEKRHLGRNIKNAGQKDKKANRRNDDLTYALIDSQSVKMVYNSEKRGFDGGKNKWTKEAHSNRYYGKYTGCSCSCCKYS